MEVEPLAGKRHVAVTERHTRKDWALQIKQMLYERYAEAIKVRLVMDNLNTHSILSRSMKHSSPARPDVWRNDWISITHQNMTSWSKVRN